LLQLDEEQRNESPGAVLKPATPVCVRCPSDFGIARRADL
jgi:hypothetical protein